MVKFKSNLKSVEQALTQAEERALKSVGLFVRSESQVRSPVGVYGEKTGVYTSGAMSGKGLVGGNLRDSNEYKLQDKTVIIGNTAEYSIYVHEGTYQQRAQKFLEDAVMQNPTKIKAIVERQLRL